MKASIVSAYSLLAGLLAVNACQTRETDLCSLPHQVTVNSNCYTGNGSQLTADEYGKTPLSFEWTIYALKDTSKILRWQSF
ncbi:hypothetical protein [Spirosoma validum]|uniref:Uncharacterized protein n=1 Tax=Spirosoma validum TaxID=2771355 RepID=A0A927B5S4_9BACT|nr:hypothetical protein [Spirosoma validum]MBD2755761.1 hypothetical protein [Spirosoma validum]